MFKRYILITAAGSDPPRRFRRKSKKRLDSSRRPVTGTEFEYLPKQHQHRNDGRRFEIDRDRAIHLAKCHGKYLWSKRGNDAEDPGNAGTKRDQREHIEITRK